MSQLFIEEDDYIPEHRYSITSFGIDYTVDTLVKRIENDIIRIPPFQRNYRWSKEKASRFIESLILGLPVPGIFLSKEKEENRYLVVDGQQRLTTLKKFYTGRFAESQVFTLESVQKDLAGKTYNTLHSNDKAKLDDALIRATVIKQDKPENDDSSIFQVFERLNTGGVTLTPQEIRAALYYGDFNTLLKELVDFTYWRRILGKSKGNDDSKEKELILRFFALFYEGDNYKKPMKTFLNSFMKKHQNLNGSLSKTQLEELFKETTGTVFEKLGPKPFTLGVGINSAFFDAVMVGIAHNLPANYSREEGIQKIQSLKSSEEFRKTVASGTTDEASISKRVELAKKAFI